MCLAKIGSTRAWGEITAGLELPHSLSTSMGGFWSTLDANDHWPLLRATLDQLATQLLDQPPPIDYTRRRRLALTITDAAPNDDLAAFVGDHAAPLTTSTHSSNCSVSTSHPLSALPPPISFRRSATVSDKGPTNEAVPGYETSVHKGAPSRGQLAATLLRRHRRILLP